MKKKRKACKKEENKNLLKNRRERKVKTDKVKRKMGEKGVREGGIISFSLSRKVGIKLFLLVVVGFFLFLFFNK